MATRDWGHQTVRDGFTGFRNSTRELDPNTGEEVEDNPSMPPGFTPRVDEAGEQARQRNKRKQVDQEAAKLQSGMMHVVKHAAGPTHRYLNVSPEHSHWDWDKIEDVLSTKITKDTTYSQGYAGEKAPTVTDAPYEREGWLSLKVPITHFKGMHLKHDVDRSDYEVVHNVQRWDNKGQRPFERPKKFYVSTPISARHDPDVFMHPKMGVVPSRMKDPFDPRYKGLLDPQRPRSPERKEWYSNELDEPALNLDRAHNRGWHDLTGERQDRTEIGLHTEKMPRNANPTHHDVWEVSVPKGLAAGCMHRHQPSMYGMSVQGYVPFSALKLVHRADGGMDHMKQFFGFKDQRDVNVRRRA